METVRYWHRHGRRKIHLTQLLCLLGFWAAAFPAFVTRTRPMSDFCLNAAQEPRSPNGGTFDSALCIVPPDDAWDVIQRARHLARDSTFYTWPPAIRLFHPFVSTLNLTDAATDIAHLIQTRNISSFDVTLDQLLIVPHFELLEAMEDRIVSLPKQMTQRRVVSHDSDTGHIASSSPIDNMEDLDEVQQLIRKEEIKGMKKLQQRLAKANKQSEINKIQAQQRLNTQQHALSPKEVMKQQKEDLQKFNGPCVVCLEPDEESKARLHALREILRQDIFFDYDGFSVSSSVSINADTLPRHVLHKHQNIPTMITTNASNDKDWNYTTPASFRPTLVLGAFSSVNKAVHFAKKLQRLWEPLTFHVSDLHVVSRTKSKLSTSIHTDPQNDHSAGLRRGISSSFSSFQHSNTYDGIVDKDDDIFMAQGEYGCDAMIFLMGEEWQLEPEGYFTESENAHIPDNRRSLDGYDHDEFRQRSDSEYEPGEESFLLIDYTNEKYDHDQDTINYSETRDLNRYYDPQYVQELLDDDDDMDEGATITVGRTQFFMGEMRKYIGMPAYSPMDGKDRVLGDGISALDRRKSTVNRKVERWSAEYGEERD